MSIIEAASIQQFEDQNGIVGKEFYFANDSHINEETISFGANFLITTVSAAYTENYPDPFIVQGPMKFRVIEENSSYSALMLPIITTDEGRNSQFVCVVLISKDDRFLRRIADIVGEYFQKLKEQTEEDFYNFICRRFKEIISSLERLVKKEFSSFDESEKPITSSNQIDQALLGLKRKFPGMEAIIYDNNQFVISKNSNIFTENDLFYIGAMTGSALVQASKVMIKFVSSRFTSMNSPIIEDIAKTKLLVEQEFSGKKIRMRIAAEPNFVVVVFAANISPGMLTLASESLLKSIKELEI